MSSEDHLGIASVCIYGSDLAVENPAKQLSKGSLLVEGLRLVSLAQGTPLCYGKWEFRRAIGYRRR